MAQHTPRPWTVESDGTTVTMGGQCVITAPAPDMANIEEQRANAALIAAAPDLLTACREAMALIDDSNAPGALLILGVAIAFAEWK